MTDDPRYRRLVWLVNFAQPKMITTNQRQEDLRKLDINALRSEVVAFCVDSRAWPEGPSLPFTRVADQDTLATLSERRVKQWQRKVLADLDHLLDEGFPFRTVRLPVVSYAPIVIRGAVSPGGSGAIWSDVTREYRNASGEGSVTSGWWAGVAEVLGWGAARLRRCPVPTCQRVFVARHPTAQGCGPIHARQMSNRKDHERRREAPARKKTQRSPRRT